jgi:hypothetical protein
VNDGPKLKVHEHILLEKFDGEYREGATPVEIIEVDVIDGEIVSIKKEKHNAADERRT